MNRGYVASPVWASFIPLRFPSPDHQHRAEAKRCPEAPRSRFINTLNVIEFNTAHKNHIDASVKGESSRIHYENMCYAREIALDRWCFLKDNPHEMSEKITELTLIADKVFGFGVPELPRKRGRKPKTPT